MIAKPVSAAQRFTPSHPCPVCAGYDRLPRGDGKRCHGFLSEDGRYAHCSREEHAGPLPYDDDTDTYCHFLAGDCRCGQRHGPPAPASDNGRQPFTIVATYDYQAADRSRLYQVVRLDPKDFRQRRPDGNGGWVWKLDGVPRVLYRLPQLLDAAPDEIIFIPEGEKDVEALAAVGAIATTNVGGAGKWRKEYAEALAGRPVVILPDNDQPGRDHAEQVARSLHGTAASVKVLHLPGLPDKGDVSDWLAQPGNHVGQLRELARACPEWSGNQEHQPHRENRASGRFTFTALGDLLAEPEEATAYVVEGLLPTAGTSLLVAKPKVGKSVYGRNCALSVASGRPFFGRGTIAGAVLILCLEEKRPEVARHFRQMGADGRAVFIHTGPAPENPVEELATAIAAYRPALVIVDPLQRLARLRDVNDYAEVTRALEPFNDLARASGCHIMCLHHAGKAERDDGDSVLGSTGFFAGVDTLLVMRRSPDGRRTVSSVQRYGDDLPPTVVDMDADTGLVRAAGDVALLKLADTEAAILDALGDEALPEQAIKERVGGEMGVVARALRALADPERGAVIRTGKGVKNDPFLYASAGAPPE